MNALAPRPAADSIVQMVQIVLPSDANALGAAFGGSVMGWIDICAAVCGQRHSRQTVVTASMDDLHFHAPILVGWTVSLKARVIAAFSSSMEIGVTVHAENPSTGERTLTTSALLTFVALGKDGTRLTVPPLLVTNELEAQAVEDAKQRKADRLNRKDRSHRWRQLLDA